jgi:predicted dehydrogenase
MLGAGNFANATLLPAIRKDKATMRVGIASVGGLHAQATGKKFGFAYAASAEKDVLDDPAITTLAILTRHDTHADLVVRALKAGKHVFVEKPLAIDADGLKKVQAALKKAPGLLTVGFNRRFAPLAVRLDAFLAGRSEPLYMHYRVNAGYIPLNHWTQDPLLGGGRIVGEGCHFIDFLTFLAGAAPISVTARALPDNGKYRQDNVSMTFTFPDGSLGVVDYLADGDKAFPKERVEVFCGGQVAVLDDFRRLELVRGGKRTTVKSALRQDKGHAGEWQAFAAAIRAGGPPPIPYAQLLGVTRASFAAVEALRTGQGVEIA